jgi:quercetin dioxygenase-like cupin family protein
MSVIHFHVRVITTGASIMMMTRRDAVASLALFAELLALEGDLEAAPQAAPGTPAPAARPPVFKQDLPNLTMDGWEVTVSHVDYAPGRVGAPHHHAGFVLAYVLEGTVITKISGQGEEKTYTTGQMFYEQPGATHEVSKNASQTKPARLLAMIFAKKGSTLTTPGRASDI